jgi:3'-phosphoadenosine 5'-phosphosulfate sulfotransferase (PAPS reductase)/FAD synthetase
MTRPNCHNRPDYRHIVSISGGKDSTALRLLAIEQGVEHVAVFADTGHEHPETYRYVEYLEKETGPIVWVKADFTSDIERKRRFVAEKWEADGVPLERVNIALDNLHPTGNPFLDLCMLKGRFPSTRARFCSQMLKHEPIFEQVVDPLLEQGIEVISWQGVRADESLARRDLLRVEDVGGGLWNYRPIIDWTVEDVFAMHDKHGIKPNPLYQQGMGRVGCMPCIHARKAELRAIAERFPEVIDRVEEWEAKVAHCSKRGCSTLFPIAGTVFDDGQESTYLNHGVRKHVEWSKTTRGGRQYDLLGENEPAMCSSIYGLCE